MSTRAAYPLASALRVREIAVDQAHEAVALRELELEAEKGKLRRLEMRREVLTQEREEASDRLYDTEGADALEVSEIDRRRGAHDFLTRRIAAVAKEIRAQEIETRAAQARLDGARGHLRESVRDLDVLEKHHADWRSQQRRLERRQEEKRLQEVVTNRYRSRNAPETRRATGRIKR